MTKSKEYSDIDKNYFKVLLQQRFLEKFDKVKFADIETFFHEGRSYEIMEETSKRQQDCR